MSRYGEMQEWLAEPIETTCELARNVMRRRRSGVKRSDTGRSRKELFARVQLKRPLLRRDAGVVELAALEKR